MWNDLFASSQDAAAWSKRNGKFVTEWRKAKRFSQSKRSVTCRAAPRRVNPIISFHRILGYIWYTSTYTSEFKFSKETTQICVSFPRISIYENRVYLSRICIRGCALQKNGEQKKKNTRRFYNVYVYIENVSSGLTCVAPTEELKAQEMLRKDRVHNVVDERVTVCVCMRAYVSCSGVCVCFCTCISFTARTCVFLYIICICALCAVAVASGKTQSFYYSCWITGCAQDCLHNIELKSISLLLHNYFRVIFY